MADDLPFSKTATPDYLEVQDRRPLSKWEFATLFLKQEGKCASCGERLEKGKVRDEHLHALSLGGGNELTNRALWCLDCTKPKNASDRAADAKGKRIRGETCAGPKRQIISRGFQKQALLSPKDDRVSKAPGSITTAGVSALSKKHPGYRKPSWGRKAK